ncbi:34169_t:CDS:1, partial [Racocetra persica]
IISIGFVLTGLASPLPNDSPQLLQRGGTCGDGYYYTVNRILIFPCYIPVKQCTLYIGSYLVPYEAIGFHQGEVHVDFNKCYGFNYKTTPIKTVKVVVPHHGTSYVKVSSTHKSYDYSEEHSSSSSTSSHSKLHVTSDSKCENSSCGVDGCKDNC